MVRLNPPGQRRSRPRTNDDETVRSNPDPHRPAPSCGGGRLSKGEDAWQRVLEAGLKTFAEHGYGQSSARQIAWRFVALIDEAAGVALTARRSSPERWYERVRATGLGSRKAMTPDQALAVAREVSRAKPGGAAASAERHSPLAREASSGPVEAVRTDFGNAAAPGQRHRQLEFGLQHAQAMGDAKGSRDG